jgi:hypothetical protein
MAPTPAQTATGDLNRFLESCLGQLPEADRGDFLRYGAGRFLLALAHTQGPQAAAEEAYAMADTLATAA